MNDDFQLWVCIGTIVRDPELKYLPSGAAVLDFLLESVRHYEYHDEQREERSTSPCVAFGKQAETLKAELHAGQRVLVQGYWKEQRWEDKYGKPRSRHTVSVREITRLDGSDVRVPQKAQSKPLPPDDKEDDLPF